jgi:hypothetical protein
LIVFFRKNNSQSFFAKRTPSHFSQKQLPVIFMTLFRQKIRTNPTITDCTSSKNWLTSTDKNSLDSTTLRSGVDKGKLYLSQFFVMCMYICRESSSITSIRHHHIITWTPNPRYTFLNLATYIVGLSDGVCMYLRTKIKQFWCFLEDLVIWYIYVHLAFCDLAAPLRSPRGTILASILWAYALVTYTYVRAYHFFLKSDHPIPWRDSISRPIAPVSSVAGRDDTTRLCRQGGYAVIRVTRLGEFLPFWPLFSFGNFLKIRQVAHTFVLLFTTEKYVLIFL